MSTKFICAMRMLTCISLVLIGATMSIAQTQQIRFHCASKAEGQQLMDSRTEYYGSLNQNDLEWRMRKTNATLEEFKQYAREQVLDFTQEEKDLMKRSVDFVEERLQKIGCRLPFPTKDIVIVKTTMDEESGAGGYTNGTVIYLGRGEFEYFMRNTSDEEVKRMLFLRMTKLVIHEMFHCLTRNNADFRRSMYSLIGFTILDHDINFPTEVKKWILTNPDVEHLDNYIEVTIDGEQRPCELIVKYTKTWEEAAAQNEYASFFNHNECVLVPLDDLDKAYPMRNLKEFWDKVGRNTSYVFAPEECLADNFAYAVLSYGEDNYRFRTPELIENIISLLQNKYGGV